LYYLNSRNYNPEIGRFINADGQINGGIIGDNLYSYTNNNPVMYVDYNGKAPVAVIGSIVGILKDMFSGIGGSLIDTSKEILKSISKIYPYIKYTNGDASRYSN
jgi:hypothetical protein